MYFLWETQFIFKYKPDFGLIGRSSVCDQLWCGIVFLNLQNFLKLKKRVNTSFECNSTNFSLNSNSFKHFETSIKKC